MKLIIDDEDYWVTSLQLAEISGRQHKHVLRDIERDVRERKDELLEVLKSDLTAVDILGQPKFGLTFKETLRKYMSSIKVENHEYIDNSNRSLTI